MEKKVYITKEEQEKCRRVAEAFAELYGLENILVMDAGRYGFVKLQYYKEPQGFDDVITFTDSQSMFENLWQEWLDTKLYLMAKGTPLMEKGYGGVLKSLPEEKQKELTERKADFAIKAGITLLISLIDSIVIFLSTFRHRVQKSLNIKRQLQAVCS